MTTRKITLLAVFAFLLIVCIVQGIMGTISPVKTIKTDVTPDAITITKDGKEVELIKKNNTWYVGQDNYLANKSDVESMIRSVQEIKVLDKIGKSGNEETDEKYSLTDSKATFVKIFKDGKEIQSMKLGKTSSTNSQTYGSVGRKKDIYLLSGNLVSTFGKSAESLRGKTVYTIEEKDINGVNVSAGNKDWSLTKTSKKGEAQWAYMGGEADVVLDNSAVNTWIRSIAFMNINTWVDDGVALPADKLASLQISADGGVTVNVDIYEKKEGADTKYYGTCSTTTHKFELTKSQTEKFTKNFDELKAKTE